MNLYCSRNNIIGNTFSMCYTYINVYICICIIWIWLIYTPCGCATSAIVDKIVVVNGFV